MSKLMSNGNLLISSEIDEVAQNLNSITPDKLYSKQFDEITLMGNWDSTSLPNSGAARSVEYGDGKFVAIRFNSSASYYSTDGINWLQSILPFAAQWYEVTYGNGRFVAVASSSISTLTVAYSDDGIIWNSATMPIIGNWRSVTYGNGVFVAVSTSPSAAVYSADGINWYQGSSLPILGWSRVKYGGGRFVAINSDVSNVAVYSDDGINWTQMTFPSSISRNTLTYGDNKFVVLAPNSNIVTYSNDGINWSQAALPSSQNWFSITYGNGKFLATASNITNIITYSFNGIDWFQQSVLPIMQSWSDVAYGNGKFIIVSVTSSIVAYLNDIAKRDQQDSLYVGGYFDEYTINPISEFDGFDSFAVNYSGDITVPTLVNNFVWKSNMDIYFQGDIYISNSNTSSNTILDQTSNTFGLANEFRFCVSAAEPSRGIPSGRLLVYNGQRGNSLSIYYTDLSVPLNTFNTVIAKRINGRWTMTINGISTNLTFVRDAGLPSMQFGNTSLPFYIGRANVDNMNLNGQIKNVYALYKKFQQ